LEKATRNGLNLGRSQKKRGHHGARIISGKRNSSNIHSPVGYTRKSGKKKKTAWENIFFDEGMVQKEDEGTIWETPRKIRELKKGHSKKNWGGEGGPRDPEKAWRSDLRG